MDRDELRRLATEATGIQSHVFLKTPDLANLLDVLERAEERAEKAERELQASESCVAFERVTIAELRLEAHQLRTNLHLARLERDEARAERDALPEISDGLVSDAEHVVAWHRSGRIELSPAGRYSRLADYVLRVHAAKVKP